VSADAYAPRPVRHAHRPSALACGAGHDRSAVGLSLRAKVAFASARVLQRAAAAARRRIEEKDAARLRAGAFVRLARRSPLLFAVRVFGALPLRSRAAVVLGVRGRVGHPPDPS